MKFLKLGTLALRVLMCCIWVRGFETGHTQERINGLYRKGVYRSFDWIKWLLWKGNGYMSECETGAQKYPMKHDRIAIIGAGAAGVHMAYKLQEIGYTDITIFEKRNRVGGKSYTFHHKGTRHEMGTVYTTVEYTEIAKLLEEFQTGNNISSGSVTRWINPNTYMVGGYPLYVAATEFGITDTQQAMDFLMNAVQKYITLHRTFFSTYEGDFFPRPSQDVFEKTKGTFMEFLERNNITILKSIFISSHTIQGYGHLDEIPALYGLMWNTPTFLLSLVQLRGSVGIIDTGFQPLWEEIVRRERIKVIFNARISDIRRPSGKVQITYRLDNGECLTDQKRSEFDFLMISGNLKKLFQNTVRDARYKERRIFNKITYTYFTTSVVDSNYGRRGPTPSNYLIYQAYSKKDHVVWANGDSFAMINHMQGPNYTNGIYPGNQNGEFIQSAVYYQIGYERPTTQILDAELDNFTSTFGLSNHTLIKRITFDYFPRYPQKDMSAGILWDILDMQGYKRTWYIGSSVCFESIKSVLEYNKLLLRKFNLI